MLVDAKTETARNEKFVTVVIAAGMAIPLLGQVVAMIVLFCLALQIFSKSANRMKDLSTLLGITLIYLFAMTVSIFGNGFITITFWHFGQIVLLAGTIGMVALGRGGIRTAGIFALVWLIASYVDTWIFRTNGFALMAVMLFIISYWGLSKMKIFIFSK